jgi:hypothetical protein
MSFDRRRRIQLDLPAKHRPVLDPVEQAVALMIEAYEGAMERRGMMLSTIRDITGNAERDFVTLWKEPR